MWQGKQIKTSFFSYRIIHTLGQKTRWSLPDPHEDFAYFMRKNDLDRYYSVPHLDFLNELCIRIRKTYEIAMELFGMGKGPHFTPTSKNV